MRGKDRELQKPDAAGHGIILMGDKIYHSSKEAKQSCWGASLAGERREEISNIKLQISRIVE